MDLHQSIEQYQQQFMQEAHDPDHELRTAALALLEEFLGDYASLQTGEALTVVVGYVAVCRHFVDRCRALLTLLVFYVWSPVGRQELFRYWPGPDYVDHIGVSIYGFPEYDLRNFGKARSFDEIFTETYQRVSLFDKPVIIAELGVTGSPRHQRYWMYQAMRNFHRYPRLQIAVYYNGKDSPLAWGKDYPVPDWRISRSVFN